jgi:hypothetical protein
MAGRRRWALAGGLLVVAGGLTAVSTWRHWSGCRPDAATPGCLMLQDSTYGLPLWGETGHQDVLGAAATVGSAVLLCLAWLVVADWARSSAARLAMAVVVGAQPLCAAALVAVSSSASGPVLLDTGGWLLWPAEVLVVPMLLGAGWILDEAPAQILRLMLLAWAVTSYGPLHHFVDFALSTVHAPSAVGSPPGLGYVSAGTQIGLGLVLTVVSLLLGAGPEPEDGDERWGQDGFTLAA